MKTPKIPALPPLATMQIAVIVMVAIVLFLVLKKIGLIKFKSAEEKAAAKIKDEQKQQKKIIEVIINRSELFDPARWRSSDSSTLLSEDEARKAAKKIKDSWGWLNDDEDSIYGIFRNLTHKNQISQLAFYYLSEFGDDLSAVLVDRLNKNELSFLWNIIKGI